MTTAIETTEITNVVTVGPVRAYQVDGLWYCEPADYEGEPREWTTGHASLRGVVQEAVTASDTPGSPWQTQTHPLYDGPWVDELVQVTETGTPLEHELATALILALDPDAEERAHVARALAELLDAAAPTN